MKTNLLNQIITLGTNSRRWIITVFFLVLTLISTSAWGQLKNPAVITAESQKQNKTQYVVQKATKALDSRNQTYFEKELWKNEPFGERDGSRELLDKRDAFSKHFQNDNGTVTAHIASGPIHYQENGQWKTIYHTIEPSANGGFQNTYNSFRTYYPASASGEIVTVLPDGTELRDMQGMRMYYEANGQEVGSMNIANTPGSADFNKLTYSGVYGSQIDLRLTQNSTQRKMDYLLQSASALNGAPQNAQYLVFEEQVILPQGVTAKLVENKIMLSNAKGDVIAEYTNPDIYDEQPSDTEDENYLHRSEATYQIEQNGNLLTIKTKVQMTWLLDVNRNFPVVVDPTVDVFPNNQNWWSWIATTTGGAQGAWFGIGRFNNGNRRSAVQFNMSSIPTGSIINSANVLYYQIYTIGWQSNTTRALLFRQYASNVAGDPFNNTWTGLFNLAGSGTVYNQSPNGAHSTINVWRNQPLGATATSYMQNTSIGLGRFALGLDQTGVTANNQYVEFNGHASVNRPYIVVDYTEPNCGTNSTTPILFNDNTGITNVTFNTINNSTTSNNTYVNTGISTTLCKGNTYNLSVRVNTDGAWTVRARAWIDWNNDGIFSNTTESYDLGTAFNTANGVTSTPTNITVPLNAVTATVKMRIVAAEISNYPHACANNFYGEGEDYLLIITPYGIDGTISLTTPTTVCLGQPVNVSAAGGTGSPKYWVQSPAGSGTWNVFENQASNSSSNGFTFTPSTPGTYRVHARWQTACGFCWDQPGHDWNTNNNCTSFAFADFTVSPTSVAGTASSSQTICSGSTPTAITLTGNTGTIQWQSSTTSASTGFSNIGGATSSTLTLSALSSTTYYRAVVTSGACSAATSNSITITVNPTPTANAGGALSAICQGSVSAAMGGSVGGGATGGTWSGGTGTWTNANNPSTATYTAGASETGTITLTLTTSGGSCGTTTATKTITINASSTAPALSGTSPVCPATSVTINAGGGTASPGSTINWYTGPNGTGSFLGAGSSYTVTPSATSTYYARREGGCNTTADGTYTITVNGPTGIAPANGDMVWKGASNTDWAILGNWWQFNGTGYAAASAAPTTAQNVIIPANQACVLNQPNTNANAGSAKTLRIESGANLTMGNGTLTVAENWVNNGTFTPGTGTVSFTGSGTHTISGISGAHNFHNLTMNKAGEVQLSVPIAMSGALTLTNGRLNIGTFNLDLPTNTVNGGNTASFVRTSGTGTLNRNVANSAVLFPVGRGSYNPATLTNAGTADKYSIRVIDNVTDDGTAVGAPTTMAVVNRTWMINEQVAGGSNVTLGLQWNGLSEEINNFSEIGSFVAHYIAGENLWDNIGGTLQASGVIQASGIMSFSPFTVSSDNAFAPLPVELIAFTAHCQNEDVEVNWSTATEHNSQYFALQVSEDGYSWSDLYVIEAAEFSTTVLEYSYIHKNAARTKNYYRLRQIDNDGTVETYNTIMSNCTSHENVFMTFPNPSADAFTVVVNDKLLSGSNVLNISDASGKLIYSIAVDLENGSGSFVLEGLGLPAGLYYLQLNNGSYASRIIKHSFR